MRFCRICNARTGCLYKGLDAHHQTHMNNLAHILTTETICSFDMQKQPKRWVDIYSNRSNPFIWYTLLV